METKLYRNLRNRNKYIKTKRYKCGHLYWKQTIVTITPDGRIICNPVGSMKGRFFRVSKATAMDVLNEDYELISK